MVETELNCARAEPRTHMYVLATISTSAASSPAIIRDLSQTGALIEGADLPSVGEQFQLTRGTLSASGSVVWRKGRKAGLRLYNPVEISSWLPVGHAGQQRVDQAFQQIKAGDEDCSALASNSTPEHTEIGSNDLRNLADSIDALANDLAKDGAIVTRHALKLQALDRAAQVLRKIADGS